MSKISTMIFSYSYKVIVITAKFSCIGEQYIKQLITLVFLCKLCFLNIAQCLLSWLNWRKSTPNSPKKINFVSLRTWWNCTNVVTFCHLVPLVAIEHKFWSQAFNTDLSFCSHCSQMSPIKELALPTLLSL